MGHQAEEAAFVGRGKRAPARAPVVGAIELAALGRDVQAIADAHDAVQVIVRRQLAFVGGRFAIVRGRRKMRWRELRARPVAATVVGREIGAVGADGDTADAVRKPQIEQGLLGFRGEVRARPVFAAVRGVEDGLVVAYGPTVVGIDEVHRRQHHPRRHALRLAPGGALIVRQQHVAALADRHEAIAGDRQIQQQGAGGERFDLRGLVGRIRWDRSGPA